MQQRARNIRQKGPGQGRRQRAHGDAPAHRQHGQRALRHGLGQGNLGRLDIARLPTRQQQSAQRQRAQMRCKQDRPISPAIQPQRQRARKEHGAHPARHHGRAPRGALIPHLRQQPCARGRTAQHAGQPQRPQRRAPPAGKQLRQAGKGKQKRQHTLCKGR